MKQEVKDEGILVVGQKVAARCGYPLAMAMLLAVVFANAVLDAETMSWLTVGVVVFGCAMLILTECHLLQVLKTEGSRVARKGMYMFGVALPILLLVAMLLR